MATEIRPARPEEMAEFERVARTSLMMTWEVSRYIRPDWTFCVFEDGKLATSYSAWPLTMRFNGEGVPVSGISTVSTLPVYRRRGHVRKVTSAHFELLRESGERPIAILHATLTAIYQRYGYAMVSVRNSYNVEPRNLGFPVPGLSAGAFREVGDEEFELLRDLYGRFVEERTGYIQRGRGTWKAGVLASPPHDALLNKAVYEEGGNPLGYLIYYTETQHGAMPGPVQRLTVRDLVWLSATAYQAIWDYLSHMDLASNIIWEWAPADDPLPHLLLEPQWLHIGSHNGIMARLVDIEWALTKRRYSQEGKLTFEVVDDLCPWNAGCWKLEASPAGALVKRTGELPELTVPVSTLAMLAFGHISATEAARMGRLDALDHGALLRWDSVMRTRHRPFCADLF